MTEQQPRRRPLLSKVAGYQAYAAAWATSPEAEEAKQRKAEAEAAQQELMSAFKAAGFKVYAPDRSITGATIGMVCDRDTAVALAEWLRAQPPAKRPRKR